MRLLASCAIASLLGWLASPLAQGDQYNYQNLLVGTRSAGMGGADVAFADSVTGAYYNPAGVVDASARLISVSLSAYRIDLSGLSSITAGEGQSGNAVGFQFNSFPLNFGLISRLGDRWGLRDHTLAFNFFVVDNNVGGTRVDVRIPQVAEPYLRVLRQDKETIEFTTTWAARRGPLSAGLGLAYRLRVESLLVDTLVSIRDSVTYHLRDIEAMNGGLFARAGLLWRAWRGLRLGFCLTTPAATVHSAAVVRDSRVRTGVAMTLDPGTESDMAYYTPWRLALGGAYQWDSGARIAADIALHTPVGRYDVIPGAIQAEGRFTVNANAGFELPLWKTYIARIGAFTNFAATPSPPDKTPDDFDDPARLPHVDYIGGTLGASMIKGVSSLDLTLNYQFGKGTVPAQAARGYDPLRAHVVVLMIGGTYSFGEEEER